MRQVATKIMSVDDALSEKKALDEAASILKNGGLVAFPTETVYGLGALGLETSSVAKIFAVKERQMSNPLTLMISDLNHFFHLSSDLSKEAKCLAAAFWPGPLTLIVKADSEVPEIVTAGTHKVGFRMPDHVLALKLLKRVGVPLAVPSANLSGRPSPTAACHVAADLNGRIELILDGGKSELGLESTVLDLTEEKVRILRPGSITQEKIEELLQQKIFKAETKERKHYQPKAQVIVVSGRDEEKVQQKIRELIEQNYQKRIAVFSRQATSYEAEINRCLDSDVSQIAAHLFEYLREMDEMKMDLIIIEGIEKKGLGIAVMNRLEKAAGGYCLIV